MLVVEVLSYTKSTVQYPASTPLRVFDIHATLVNVIENKFALSLGYAPNSSSFPGVVGYISNFSSMLVAAVETTVHHAWIVIFGF